MASSNGSASPPGVKLPSISFLSGHQSPSNSTGNRLPSASNLGIFLNKTNESDAPTEARHEIKEEAEAIPQQSENDVDSRASDSAAEKATNNDANQAEIKDTGSITTEKTALSSPGVSRGSEATSHDGNETPLATSVHQPQEINRDISNNEGPHALPLPRETRLTAEEDEKAEQSVAVVERDRPEESLVTEKIPEKRTNGDQRPSATKRAKYVMDKSPIVEIIKTCFPRMHHLGTIMYNPTATWLTLRTSQLNLKSEHHERFEEIKRNFLNKLKNEYSRQDVKYIPAIPPLSNDYINSIIEMKIPARFIWSFKQSMEHEGIVVRKRELWGGAGGIYTDDSDILCVLAHLGLFNDNMDLTDWNENWSNDDIITPLNFDVSSLECDLSVEILLLPSLPQYYGFYANGINSRSWTGKDTHDGLSFAVYNVKWETPGTYLKDPSLSKRYQAEIYRDQKISKELMKENPWNFDFSYYKSLKEKYKNAAS